MTNRMIAAALLAALPHTLFAPSGGIVAADDRPPARSADSPSDARSLFLLAKYAEAKEMLRRSAAEQKALPPPSADYAATLNLLGELSTILGDYAQADGYLSEAAAIFKQLPKRQAEYADTLTKQAKASQRRADYSKAASLIDQSFAVLSRNKLEKTSGYARALVVLGDLNWDRGKSLEARDKDYPRAIELFKATDSAESIECAAAQNNLGLLSRSVHRLEAEKLICAAMDTRKRLVGEHHPDYANSLNSLALLRRSQGRWPEIEPLLEQALEIRKETLGERHPDYATTLNSLATFYREQGDYLRAEPEARRAAEICERALGSSHPYYASALNNLAMLYRDEANYVDAEPAFKKAMNIYDATLGRDHSHRLTVRRNLAELYEAEGDHLRAKRLFDQESEARRKSAASEPHGYALWLAGIARIERKEGRFENAKKLLKQASDYLAKVRGAELDSAALLEELANINVVTEDYGLADEQLRQVLGIRRRRLGEEHPDYAAALESQANLYLKYFAAAEAQLKYLAAAESKYQIVLKVRKKVLGAQHPQYAVALANLADARRQQGKDALAAEDYKQALNIVRKHLQVTSVSQSEQQQLAMTRTARVFLDNYLSLMIDLPLPRDDLYAEVLAWKGAVSRRQQMLRKMRPREEADAAIAGLYEELETAARQLAQLSHAEPPAGDPAANGRELDQLGDKVEQLQRELAAKSPDFRREVELRSRTSNDIREVLPENVILIDLLEYWHLPKAGSSKQAVSAARRLIAFVVRRERPTELIDLGPAATIEKAVNDWLTSLEQPVDNDPGARLRKLLWAPLESRVSDAETVLISPDGATAWIPWGALPAKEPGKFLIESQSFVTLPVPQLLPDILACKPHPDRDAPTLLLVGNVDFGADPGKADVASRKRSAALGRGGDRGPRWRSLDGSKAEMVQVQDSFDEAFSAPSAVTTLSGAIPTEEAIRTNAPRHHFLHFATHGFFTPPQVALTGRGLTTTKGTAGERAARSNVASFHPGILSGIVLAGANHPENLDRDDGILTALEIEQLDLSSVELATLSACQTGIGNTVSGEGLLGLQRAFQIAGATSVLAALWSVDDRATATLMGAFYENLWVKKCSRAEALRQAQIKMLSHERQRGTESAAKKTDNAKERGMEFGTRKAKVPPRLWAAFVLSGDWR